MCKEHTVTFSPKSRVIRFGVYGPASGLAFLHISPYFQNNQNDIWIKGCVSSPLHAPNSHVSADIFLPRVSKEGSGSLPGGLCISLRQGVCSQFTLSPCSEGNRQHFRKCFLVSGLRSHWSDLSASHSISLPSPEGPVSSDG